MCGGIVGFIIVGFIIVDGIVVGIFSGGGGGVGVGVVGGAWRDHDDAAYQAILSIFRQLNVLSK